MEDLLVITPKEIVKHFYYQKFNEKVAKIFEISKNYIEVKDNGIIKAIAEIDFKIKRHFILRINDKKDFLIEKNQYSASWVLNNSFVIFGSQKPNFAFEIIKNNQTNYLNFYIDYFISTDFENFNKDDKKFINFQIEEKNSKKKVIKIDLDKE